MKNTAIFVVLLILIAEAAQGSERYTVVSVSSTKESNINAFDVRVYQRTRQIATYYSFGFLGGSQLVNNIPGLTIGAGIQLPRKKNEPYFFGVGGHLVLDKKDCDSGNNDQRQACLSQGDNFTRGAGSRFYIQPEIGARIKIYNDVRVVSSLRFWFSNDKALNDNIALSVGVQF